MRERQGAPYFHLPGIGDGEPRWPWPARASGGCVRRRKSGARRRKIASSCRKHRRTLSIPCFQCPRRPGRVPVRRRPSASGAGILRAAAASGGRTRSTSSGDVPPGARRDATHSAPTELVAQSRRSPRPPRSSRVRTPQARHRCRPAVSTPTAGIRPEDRDDPPGSGRSQRRHLPDRQRARRDGPSGPPPASAPAILFRGPRRRPVRPPAGPAWHPPPPARPRRPHRRAACPAAGRRAAGGPRAGCCSGHGEAGGIRPGHAKAQSPEFRRSPARPRRHSRPAGRSAC
jgi:hypothetical protein